MKAIYLERHGGPEVLTWGNQPAPVPGPEEVLVQVKACALNHLDIWLRMGIPGLPVVFPHILGADVAGIIVSVGTEVVGWKSGQKVLVAPGISCGNCAPCRAGNDHLCDSYDILGQRSQGGYAEFVKVPAVNLLPFPEKLSDEESATLPLVYTTAWQMLVTNGRLEKNQTVLVHSAGSGLGTAAIQLAKYFGARVITTVGSVEKVRRANALGADEVILYREQDFNDEVMRLTNRRGADLVVEHIGQETFVKSLDCVAKGGKLLTCGATTGRQIQFDLRDLFSRNVAICGNRMGRRDGLKEVLALVETRQLKPVVDSVYPLSQAAEAHRRMESRAHFGKIVLTL